MKSLLMFTMCAMLVIGSSFALAGNNVGFNNAVANQVNPWTPPKPINPPKPPKPPPIPRPHPPHN